MKHRIVFLIAAIVCGVWCAAAQNKHAGHEYVDLGLPSGTKWATCNVGASKPEEYGNYYAWGETTTKSTYKWSTYKYGSDYAELTKYCTDSGYGKDGFADNKTVLDPEDDAARANWGGAWRMPTDAEWTELRENCEWTWTTRDGVNGYEVKGTNGNSIFLPAAGCNDYGLRDAGNRGYYWSSSLNADYPYGAWDGYFYSGYVDGNNGNRFYGQSVRLVLFVREAEEKAHITEQEKTAGAQNKHAGHEYVDLGLPSGTKWATCNVGASTPEDYGNYYAWGETKPKTTYSWDTYKWVNFHEETLLKYNTSSSYGTMDNKTVLDPADDAARAAWGGSWRMPTETEWTELRENCEWTWTTRNGVNGYEVKGTNGNSIFLPAAGCNDYGLRDAGNRGYYWSSSLNADYPYGAWNGYFYSGYVDGNNGNRFYGQSVRLVLFVREAEEKARITEQEKTAGAQNKHAGHNYVDLGLSVKWATCNVGASTSEEYGNYYAWGETTPKDYYDWNTYKWATATYDARHWSLETLTKYCTKSSDGRVDNKTRLDSADDAARANWGGAWRMPTDAEWTELREKCTWIWTTLNGVNGYEVEGTNGNSIFLPAASFRVSDDLYNAGYNGYYWSSSLNTDYPSDACYVIFGSDGVYRRNGSRYDGQSVRPVFK